MKKLLRKFFKINNKNEYYIYDLNIDIADEQEISNEINSFCTDNCYEFIQIASSNNPYYSVRFIFKKKRKSLKWKLLNWLKN